MWGGVECVQVTYQARSAIAIAVSYSYLASPAMFEAHVWRVGFDHKAIGRDDPCLEGLF